MFNAREWTIHVSDCRYADDDLGEAVSAARAVEMLTSGRIPEPGRSAATPLRERRRRVCHICRPDILLGLPAPPSGGYYLGRASVSIDDLDRRVKDLKVYLAVHRAESETERGRVVRRLADGDDVEPDEIVRVAQRAWVWGVDGPVAKLIFHAIAVIRREIDDHLRRLNASAPEGR